MPSQDMRVLTVLNDAQTAMQRPHLPDFQSFLPSTALQLDVCHQLPGGQVVLVMSNDSTAYVASLPHSALLEKSLRSRQIFSHISLCCFAPSGLLEARLLECLAPTTTKTDDA